ncbi:MMPL family transporter, partial [Flavihumibacter sp. CACIAM 22H1]|uniref:efflux RND transporter permease subunit n=1 Tax=Flavihumibacter sp. CACIAM 22H1 TaxID=1812911 RepID=UPI0025BEDE97
MWQQLGSFVLKNRLVLIIGLLLATAFMGYHASKVQMSYEFAKAIPTDNPKYQAYISFKKQFGEDGNMLVIGLQTDRLFEQPVFEAYRQLQKSLKKVTGVESILGIPGAVNLVKDSASEQLKSVRIFPDTTASQASIDSAYVLFRSLPFYRGLLYNPDTNSWLMALGMNKGLMASPARTRVIQEVVTLVEAFGKQHQLTIHYSGLPLIRTQIADRIAKEMKWLLIGSLLLSAVILLIFFRSISAMLISLAVVIMGVIWSVGIQVLIGYKITLLTALIPPLIVVIGIPNCIYFLNKYHVSWNETGVQKEAIRTMVGKMGIVTLFCNIAAAIGFAVFALTKSAILKEFGVVAGISIMVIFVISFIFIPVVLSYLKAPKSRHTRYLDNKWLQAILDRLERWSL